MSRLIAPIGLACPLLMLAALCGCWTRDDGVSEQAGTGVVAAVRRDHPRLILVDADLPALREGIKANPVLAGWYAKVRESAAALLTVPPIDYAHGPEGNLLGACGQAVDRIYRLGLIYRIEGDKQFSRRGIDEMLHAAQLDSWDPAHFLDTAELTHAMAIGYDWFYPELTVEERTAIRTAICRKGLEEGLCFLKNPWPVVTRYWNFNWAVCNFNWNQVCNGGLTFGALAVADEEPGVAGQVLAATLRSIRRAMAEFAPDGGWVEGPGYWEYATRYNVYFLAAIETALGPAAIEPYLGMPGFDKTGEFRLHMVGPLDLTFNFADSHDGLGWSAQMFWMARRFKRPVYAWHAAHAASPSPLDILWYDPEQQSPREAGLPLDAYFRHVEAAFFRGAWEDRNAVFVGFKGGANFFNHSHADLGTFVLDADGCRWAIDLGRDSYTLPGYFEIGRLIYYRLKTEGHNTLLFDGRNQRLDAQAPLVAFHSGPDRAFAVADLSQAYGLNSGAVRRGVMLLNRRNVLIQDDIHLARGADLVWQMHTRAEIAVQGQRAALRQGDKTLTATICSPAEAAFEVLPASPPPPQAQQPDVRKLAIRLKLPAGDTRLAVTLCSGNQGITPDLESLAAWIQEAPISALP
jgi:hypothetical protein